MMASAWVLGQPLVCDGMVEDLGETVGVSRSRCEEGDEAGVSGAGGEPGTGGFALFFSQVAVFHQRGDTGVEMFSGQFVLSRGEGVADGFRLDAQNFGRRAR